MDLTGTKLGKYALRAEIGQGGMGTVYHGYDPGLGRSVAVKVLASHLVRQAEFVERFMREAQAVARIKHPHIVIIYDVGEQEGYYYFVMEYLAGRSLSQILRERGQLPPDEAMPMLRQLADALDYAHEQGLIHRDVKPANVMVDQRGQVTLTDFGLVHAAQETRLTATGAMMGTPQYMSPEQVSGDVVGPPADLYSLAMIAYEVLAGAPAFDNDSTPALLYKQVHEPPPPLLRYRPDLPPSVEHALNQALAKNPQERYPSCAAFVRALKEALTEETLGGRQAKELAALYTKAKEALDNHQWALALGLCGQIITQAPTYREVGALFQRANAGLARQRAWEAQQAELGTLYDRAVNYIADQAWQEAIPLLTQIIETSGEFTYRDAPQQLAKAQAALEQAEAERRDRVEALRQEWLSASAHLLSLLSEWAELAPQDADVAAAHQALQELLQPWTAPPEPEPAPPPPAPSEPGTQPPPDLSREPSTEAEARPPAESQPPPPPEPDMIPVPAGQFWMGSADDEPQAGEEEKPQHRLSLAPFWIARYPVTNAQYKAFVDDTDHPPPEHWVKGTFRKQVVFPEAEQDHPVVNVSWHDAQAYCRWLSQKTGRPYRLLTEAEWERAARGTGGRRYPWGNEPPTEEHCNYGKNVGHTTPVGAYSLQFGQDRESPYGCADMVGNVWEWTSSLFRPYPYDPSDGREDPNAAGPRVLRGGAWVSSPESLRTTSRLKDNPDSRYHTGGFRCGMSDE